MGAPQNSEEGKRQLPQEGQLPQDSSGEGSKAAQEVSQELSKAIINAEAGEYSLQVYAADPIDVSNSTADPIDEDGSTFTNVPLPPIDYMCQKRILKGVNRWNLLEEEAFASVCYEDVFGVDACEMLKEICVGELQATAREVQEEEGAEKEGDNTDNKNSTTDNTNPKSFFIRASENPRNLVEQYALELFEFHTGSGRHANQKKASISLDAECSGAEFWVVVSENAEEQGGMRFNTDCNAEEDGLNVHPHLGSVTYLSNSGPPSVITDVLQEYERREGDFIERTDHNVRCLVSYPKVGKSITFCGSALHGASADLARISASPENPHIALFVNLWVNYVPRGSIRMKNATGENSHAMTNLPKQVTTFGEGSRVRPANGSELLKRVTNVNEKVDASVNEMFPLVAKKISSHSTQELGGAFERSVEGEFVLPRVESKEVEQKMHVEVDEGSANVAANFPHLLFYERLTQRYVRKPIDDDDSDADDGADDGVDDANGEECQEEKSSKRSMDTNGNEIENEGGSEGVNDGGDESSSKSRKCRKAEDGTKIESGGSNTDADDNAADETNADNNTDAISRNAGTSSQMNTTENITTADIRGQILDWAKHNYETFCDVTECAVLGTDIPREYDFDCVTVENVRLFRKLQVVASMDLGQECGQEPERAEAEAEGQCQAAECRAVDCSDTGGKQGSKSSWQRFGPANDKKQIAPANDKKQIAVGPADAAARADIMNQIYYWSCDMIWVRCLRVLCVCCVAELWGDDVSEEDDEGEGKSEGEGGGDDKSENQSERGNDKKSDNNSEHKSEAGESLSGIKKAVRSRMEQDLKNHAEADWRAFADGVEELPFQDLFVRWCFNIGDFNSWYSLYAPNDDRYPSNPVIQALRRSSLVCMNTDGCILQCYPRRAERPDCDVGFVQKVDLLVGREGCQVKVS